MLTGTAAVERAPRLTNDALSDGLPVLAGDEQGATLAWVHDSDGDISTRGDWRIAAAQWNTTTGNGGR